MQSPVGASLLAMDVNDNGACLLERSALWFFASELAPTGSVSCGRKKTGHHWPVFLLLRFSGAIKRRTPAASCRWP
ncbi:hypothetical protein EJA72_18085 [Pseudomonas sp. PB120]|nr:hypothetical protein [Pseudomonas sp. PB120]